MDQDFYFNEIISFLAIIKQKETYFVWSSIDMFEVLLAVDIPSECCMYVHKSLMRWEIMPDNIIKWEMEPSGIFLLSRLFRQSNEQKNEKPARLKFDGPIQVHCAKQVKSVDIYSTIDFLAKITIISNQNQEYIPAYLYEKYVNNGILFLANKIKNQTHYHSSLSAIPLLYIRFKDNINKKEIIEYNDNMVKKQVIYQWQYYTKERIINRIKIIQQCLTWLLVIRNAKNTKLAVSHRTKIIYRKTISRLISNFYQRKKNKIKTRHHYLVSKYGIFHWYQRIKIKKVKPVSKLLEFINLDRGCLHTLCDLIDFCVTHMSQFIESFEFWDQLSTFDHLISELQELKRKSKPLILVNDFDGKKLNTNNIPYATTLTSLCDFKSNKLKSHISRTKLKKWTNDVKKMNYNTKFLISEVIYPEEVDNNYMKQNLVKFMITRIDLLFENNFSKTFRSALLLMPRFHSIISCHEIFNHFYKTLARMKHHLLLFQSYILPSLLTKASEEIMNDSHYFNMETQVQWQKKFRVPFFITTSEATILSERVREYLIMDCKQERIMKFIEILTQFNFSNKT